MFEGAFVEGKDLSKLVGLVDMMSELLDKKGIAHFSYFENDGLGISNIKGIDTKDAREFSEEMYHKYIE